ncbi:MAG: CDP-glucose 4,6-dehydratase [Synergistaceae bacterium]|nr:CDP-glucose 4,6-dehydratase [Synergistaceae bacterium]
MKFSSNFYKGKSILITGHTGFKGSWMCKLLALSGAFVTGYALEPPTSPSLFNLLGLKNEVNSKIGDIRNLEQLKKVFAKVNPEIVIHMAAQPIVRDSYQNPVYTYETNVMGTVNILEAIRGCDTVKSFINVTTDKVYLNKEWVWGYREGEELNGYDPYSNSKSCSELITSSYKNSFFSDKDIAISTCRAGNVIGGGDFAKDRIIPDCVRAIEKGTEIIVRNPYSIRPYQHVLEPIVVYLMLAQAQYENRDFAGSYNVGPDDTDCWTTGDLVSSFCEKWNEKNGENNVTWKNVDDAGPHEANFLKLDCSKLKSTFNWKPRWNIEHAMEKIVEWTMIYIHGGNISECTKKQIEEFIGGE